MLENCFLVSTETAPNTPKMMEKKVIHAEIPDLLLSLEVFAGYNKDENENIKIPLLKFHNRKTCLKFVFIFSHFSLIFAYILHYTAVCSSDSISIFFIQLPVYSYVISLFAHTHKNLSPTAYTHTPNGNIEVIDLLTDSAFYTHLFQQDIFFLAHHDKLPLSLQNYTLSLKS